MAKARVRTRACLTTQGVAEMDMAQVTSQLEMRMDPSFVFLPHFSAHISLFDDL